MVYRRPDRRLADASLPATGEGWRDCLQASGDAPAPHMQGYHGDGTNRVTGVLTQPKHLSS
jgi:hypothetical protein